MAPVIDGFFLPEAPIEIRRKGLHNKVKEMVGFTQEDGSLGVPLGKAFSLLVLFGVVYVFVFYAMVLFFQKTCSNCKMLVLHIVSFGSQSFV